MSEFGGSGTIWIAIISVLGWLILAASGLRAQQISTRRTIRLALIWLAIIGGLVILLRAAGV